MTVLRSEAREVLAWCLAQPGWFIVRDCSLELGRTEDGIVKQWRRMVALGLLERAPAGGRRLMWRVVDPDHAQAVADELPQPHDNGYRPKGRGRPEFVPPIDPDNAPITRPPPRQESAQSIPPIINSVWSLAHVNRTE